MSVAAAHMSALRELERLVACPFCIQMFECSVGNVPAAVERGVQVFDLAELLEMSVAYGKPVALDGAKPREAPAATADPPTADAGETPQASV